MEAVGMLSLKRKLVGGKPIKDEFGVASKAALCRCWFKNEKKFQNQAAFVNFISRHTGRTAVQIRNALKEGDGWERELQVQGNNARGHQLQKYLRASKRGKGVRRLGGGAKQKLAFLYPTIKVWFEGERSSGNFVDREDLALEFYSLVEQVIKALEVKENADGQLSFTERSSLAECRKRFAKRENVGAREHIKQNLQAFLGARFLKPQRLVNLTIDEEKHRAICTWQGFDLRLWQVAFGTEEDLGSYVANFEDFKANVKHTVIAMSDQVPFWVKVTSGKQP